MLEATALGILLTGETEGVGVSAGMLVLFCVLVCTQTVEVERRERHETYTTLPVVEAGTGVELTGHSVVTVQTEVLVLAKSQRQENKRQF